MMSTMGTVPGAFRGALDLAAGLPVTSADILVVAVRLSLVVVVVRCLSAKNRLTSSHAHF